MNTTQAINTILNNTQSMQNKQCQVTMKNGDINYVWAWDACAGIAVRIYLMDKHFHDTNVIQVDHNNLKDYITHVGNEEVL